MGEGVLRALKEGHAAGPVAKGGSREGSREADVVVLRTGKLQVVHFPVVV